ncbi:MAG TPA: hypothetical protein VGS21_05960 [Acidimicrobiales bacterium]|nr:hypothetical protein [Acidimicrobiales bacterium]
MADQGDDGPEQTFPVSSFPVDIPWSVRVSEPIIGVWAEVDIRGIRAMDRALAKQLVKSIAGLLDRPEGTPRYLIKDPPGVGPRYATDLGEGFAAVCWVVTPPPSQSRNLPVIWVERVVPWAEVIAALVAQAPLEPDE